MTTSNTQEQVDTLAGGKGRNLYILEQRGLRIPAWAVLTGGVFREFARRTGLYKQIEETLVDLTAETAEKAFANIERMILDADADSDIVSAIVSAYKHVGLGRVAIRSSGTDEDSDSFSFAGQYNSFLNVSGISAVVEHVLRCWASAFSVRSLGYRLTHGLRLGFIEMSVIIQAMVASEKSGVVFTANPVSRSYEELVISSVYGLGEGLVSGAVDADTIIIDRTSGEIKGTTIGEKQEFYIPVEGACGCEVREVPVHKRKKLSLTEEEIKEIRSEAERIEAIFRCPQDIEWAIANGQVLILQSRAITTIPPKRIKSGSTHIWDNSNIIESYSEITSPMTFSFARDVYHQVFKEHCRLVGVPRAKLAEMDELLRNMLGYHNGYVYYNLLNWYKIIRVPPFYKIRRRIMELSMGVEESLDDETADSLHPFDAGSRLAGMVIRARSALLCAWHLLRIESSVNRFIKEFYRLHSGFESLNYSELPIEKIHAKFLELRREMLRKFGRMILLEQNIVLSIGVLKILTKKWLPDATESFFFQMTKAGDAVESLLPGQRLKKLAEVVQKDKDLSCLLQTTPPKEMYRTLLEEDQTVVKSFLEQVKRYIEDFGYRSLNELKLEEPDLREEPSVFFSMLKNIISQLEVTCTMTQQGTANEYLNNNLHGWKKWVYNSIRGRVSRSLAARERVRFCRTRAFGLARRMIKTIGEDLVRCKLLKSSRDIFYLRLQELFGWFDGTFSSRELGPIIEMRKYQEAENAGLAAPGRFVTEGIISYQDISNCGWRSRSSDDEMVDPADGSLELRGIPCCPGIAEGKALVVSEPLDVAGKILVTYRTDPGWCAILQSASALLVERGSPLTHVAIVARELGVPSIIQIKSLTKKVKTGMNLKVDGGSGIVQLI